MVKIFLTGATGFIGGEALRRITASKTSKHEITCLVRDAGKGDIVSKAFPNVRIVWGDLDDASLVEKESRNADIVFHLASTSHVVSSEAIMKGLSYGSRETTGYWIQMSGASMFSGPDISSGKYGEAGTLVYDDLKDIAEIRSIITKNQKRVVDNLVLSQQPSKIKTALIGGPLIYGVGEGPVNIRSIQTPEIARITLQKGAGFRIGAGLNCWSNVHIHDLGSLFTALLDAAEAGKSGLWNEDGIYLPENGKMAFAELCSLVAKAASDQSFIESPNIELEIDGDQANALTPHGAIILGTNAMTISTRARRSLAWEPSSPSLQETISQVVHDEAKRLGIQPRS